MKKYEVEEFLRESNAIERVYDDDSLRQAVLAFNYLMKQKELTHDVIKKTHKILMLNQSLLPNEKGYYRVVPVWIGGKQVRWENIEVFLYDWIDDMNFIADISKDSLEKQSKAFHVEYERIHPFVDGNGRTGRMFMNWWRLRNKLPLLIIHEGKEQQDYYKWFK